MLPCAVNPPPHLKKEKLREMPGVSGDPLPGPRPKCCCHCWVGRLASKSCVQCETWFCDACSQQHGEAEEVEGQQQHHITRLSPHQFCAAHPGAFIISVCTTCDDRGVCAVCIKTHVREGHTVVKLEDAAEKLKTHVTNRDAPVQGDADSEAAMLLREKAIEVLQKRRVKIRAEEQTLLGKWNKFITRYHVIMYEANQIIEKNIAALMRHGKPDVTEQVDPPGLPEEMSTAEIFFTMKNKNDNRCKVDQYVIPYLYKFNTTCKFLDETERQLRLYQETVTLRDVTKEAEHRNDTNNPDDAPMDVAGGGGSENPRYRSPVLRSPGKRSGGEKLEPRAKRRLQLDPRIHRYQESEDYSNRSNTSIPVIVFEEETPDKPGSAESTNTVTEAVIVKAGEVFKVTEDIPDSSTEQNCSPHTDADLLNIDISPVYYKISDSTHANDVNIEQDRWEESDRNTSACSTSTPTSNSSEGDDFLTIVTSVGKKELRYYFDAQGVQCSPVPRVPDTTTGDQEYSKSETDEDDTHSDTQLIVNVNDEEIMPNDVSDHDDVECTSLNSKLSAHKNASVKDEDGEFDDAGKDAITVEEKQSDEKSNGMKRLVEDVLSTEADESISSESDRNEAIQISDSGESEGDLCLPVRDKNSNSNLKTESTDGLDDGELDKSDGSE